MAGIDSGLVKQQIINHMIKHGFSTFADRLSCIRFVVAEMYEGSYCGSAFMNPDTGVIVINPGFFQLQNVNDEKEKDDMLKKVSVLVRHELMHFLLGHEARFIKYLRTKYPKTWGEHYANPELHRIANFAMDYDISNEHYDDEDKEIIKTLTLNGKFIGGLITEEQVKQDSTTIWFDNGAVEKFSGSQFNNWEHTTMENMYEMLSDAHDVYTQQRPKPTWVINKVEVKNSGDSEYDDMYNKVIAKFSSGQYTPEDILELFGRLRAHDEHIDINTWKR